MNKLHTFTKSIVSVSYIQKDNRLKNVCILRKQMGLHSNCYIGTGLVKKKSYNDFIFWIIIIYQHEPKLYSVFFLINKLFCG